MKLNENEPQNALVTVVVNVIPERVVSINMIRVLRMINSALCYRTKEKDFSMTISIIRSGKFGNLLINKFSQIYA